MLRTTLKLSQQGYKNLKLAVLACLLENLTLFLPFIVLLQAITTLIQPLIDGQPLNTHYLWLFVVIGIVAAVIFFFTYRWEYRKTYITAYQESMATRVEVAEHMRKLPLSFFNSRNLSDLTTNLMANCTTIEHVMSHVVPQMLGYSLSCVIACLLMALYDWRMALAIFSVLPLAILVVMIGKKIEQRYSQRHVAAKLAVSDQIQEYLDGIKVIKAFGLAGEKFKNLEAALRTMMKTSIRFELLAGLFTSGSIILLQMGIGIVVLIGVTLMLNGSLPILSFLAFLLISLRIYGPVIAVMTLLPEFFYLLVSMENMQKLRQTKIMAGKDDISLTNVDISLNDVTFAYNQHDVIKQASLRIPQNQVTALVGPSGSGKSTLSRLIARFWDVKSGEITIGGHNIREIAPDSLMAYMSVVFQDVILFNDTVFNNIRLGKQDATDDEVYEVARRARCDEFIQRLPNGYQTVLSENGASLSGGERQRLSIARALLKDAPIILLDEATASLDPENEVYIQEAISELVHQRTVIVIAHRLRTIVNADQIVVLDEGRIVEKGDFNSLMSQNGLFKKLYNLQQQSAGWHMQ